MTGKELEYLVSGANLTITEAANLLGISRQTLYAWYGKAELKEKDVAHILNTLSNIDNKQNFVAESQLEYNKSTILQPLEYSNQVKQVPFSDFMETEYLPIEAQAGYLDSLESQDAPKLDTMLIPKEYDKGNYLVIEIKGDSMNDGSNRSIQDGDKLLCKELQKHHWTSKLHFNQYIFVIASTDGIVCKQITSHDISNGIVTCHSWNPVYKDYTVNLENVYKVFYVKKIVERKIKF